MAEGRFSRMATRNELRRGVTAARESGFTLIELMVSLMIFGILASAGVMLLRGSADTQAAVSRRLDALADTQRGVATLDADLAQATNRISRTRAGTLAPAFFGRAPGRDEALMEFVRGGWSNPGNQRHPGLQKVEYWWRENRFERIGYPAIDGAAAPVPAVLFESVTALQLRYRSARGEWRDVWAPSDPSELPVAIELVLTRKAEPQVALRFLVGPAVGQNVEKAVPSPQRQGPPRAS